MKKRKRIKLSYFTLVIGIIFGQCKSTEKISMDRDRESMTVRSFEIKGLKGEIHFMDGNTEKFSGYIRGSAEKGTLISVRNRFGIEGFRIWFLDDSICVINRIEKKYAVVPAERYRQALLGVPEFEKIFALLTGNTEMLFKTYGTSNEKGTGRKAQKVSSMEDEGAYAEWKNDTDTGYAEYLIYRNREVDIKIEYVRKKGGDHTRAPEKVHIATKGRNRYGATVLYGEVTVNVPVRLDFRIPEGYERENDSR